MRSAAKNAGFTLVELAIVLTIVGLLIGGVLKGQELLQNARMTASAAQIKASTTAVITFRDIYKALPGDMRAPSVYLNNCTTAPCSTAGNGDGIIGGALSSGGYTYNDENINVWRHLGAADLLNGIDPNGAIGMGTTTAVYTPAFPLGSKLVVFQYNSVPDTYYLQGLNGIYYLIKKDAGGGAVPFNVFAKYDIKYDDGAPYTGDVLLSNDACGIVAAPAGSTSYNLAIATPCVYRVDAGIR